MTEEEEEEKKKETWPPTTSLLFLLYKRRRRTYGPSVCVGIARLWAARSILFVPALGRPSMTPFTFFFLPVILTCVRWAYSCLNPPHNVTSNSIFINKLKWNSVWNIILNHDRNTSIYAVILCTHTENSKTFIFYYFIFFSSGGEIRENKKKDTPSIWAAAGCCHG